MLFDDFSETKLMQTNLAFPLLKKLYEIGDEKSKKVVKEEITTRLLSESESAVKYIANRKYLDYFTHEELTMIFSEFSHTKLSHLITESRLLTYFISVLYLFDSESDILKNIQVLDLNQDNYDSEYYRMYKSSRNTRVYIPPSIDKLTSLKRLTIKDIRITFLPESIGNLQSLTSIELSEMLELESLPNSIENLPNLQSLTITRSSGVELPESFGNLKSLQTLDLRNNKLRELPESFGNLKSLQTLDLRYNNLTKLPESFGNLQSLQELNLSKNFLRKLPESFGNLKSLQILTIASNNLVELPESFCELQSLKSLSFGLKLENSLMDNYISTLSPSKKLQLKSMLKKIKNSRNTKHRIKYKYYNIK